jgi:AhpD family alkylhydroperoxidase
MTPRMKSPALSIPGARQALLSIAKLTHDCDVPKETLELVQTRIGQLNGCSVCVDMHCRALKKHGTEDTKIFMLSAWRETPYYTDAERAALALAESVTRLCDATDAVPDDIWNEAAKHYSEKALGGLLLAIGMANFWNRLNVPTRQVTGPWVAEYV